jgi:AraC-like DNA-binding protein
MGLIAALLPTPRALSRLEGAVGSNHHVRACATWAALEQCCTAHPVAVAVVDLYADGTPNFEALRRLRARFSTLAVVAYVALVPDRNRDLFDLGRAGLVGLLLTDVDDRPRTIQQVVEQAEARGVADELRRHLAGQPMIVRDAVLIAVLRAHEMLTGDRLATILARPRRTVSQALADHGFPPPAKLVTWGRLIVAAQMLLDRQRSADAVARALAFPSGSAFRNTCQRYLGLRPNEIRTAGGPRAVIDRFLAEAGLGTP